MIKVAWGMPVILDLFFAGLAAGAFCFAVLMSRKRGEGFRICSRAGAFLAPLAVSFGLCMLIVDLHNKPRFWYTMTVFNTDSPMSIGVWMLSSFSGIAFLYAIFQIPADLRRLIPVIGRWPLWENQGIRNTLGVVGVPIALMVSIYTGVLLSSAAMPLWRSFALPALFCFSSMATGFAGGILAAILSVPAKRREIIAGPFQWLQQGYRILLPAYLLSLIAYVLFFFSGGRQAEVMPLISGWNGLIWWLGVVGFGILLPMVMSMGKARLGLSKVYTVLGALLVGGLLLRMVLVFVGQVHVIATAYRFSVMS